MEKHNLLFLIALLIISLPFTFGGCGGGGADDFLPDPFSVFYGIVVDDLNDDVVLDIAVAMYFFDEGNEYYAPVILNDPNSPGDFFPADAYRLLRNCCLDSIASGDLNEDGFSDIAISGYNSPYISVLFQDSTSPGNFFSPITILVGMQIAYLAIGDLNEDGFNDIAISGYNGPHLSILFQDSTNPGNFLPLVSFGITSYSVAIADIDGDFINDIAVAGGGKVKLLFQDPVEPGNFSTPVILNAGNAPKNVKIGDLDKDGNPDLVVGDGTSQDGTPGGIDVLLQDNVNPGEFLPAVNYDFGCSTQEISLGDLNNDGLLDVAVASRCSSCKITILFQDISNIGTFLPAIQYSCIQSEFGFDAWSIAVGDMNDDNFNDLIISENGVVIRLQDPANPGTFSNRIIVYNPN